MLHARKYRETLQLVEKWQWPADRVNKIDMYMRAVMHTSGVPSVTNTTAGVSAAVTYDTHFECARCALELTLLVITPCGCLFCPVCLDVLVCLYV